MATFPTSTDVLVVGAGPTGLTLACLLRSAGIDVLVVDRSPRRSSDSRASVLHTRGVEILDTVEVADTLIDQGVPIASARYYDMGLPLGEVRFDTLDGPAPFALGIGQHRIEAELIDRLEALGSKVRRSRTLEALEDGGDVVHATIGSSDGRSSVVTARYVVGCDGAASTVRSLRGLEGPATQSVDTFVLATVDISGPLDPSAMHLFSAPDGFCVLNPLPGDTFRLTASMPDDPTPPSAEQLQATLTSRGPRTDTLVIGKPSHVSRYRVRRSVAPAMSAGLVFLAGDSAHTFSPVGGQGMNTGLHDAANLAWKLADVCRGFAPLRLLETYGSERLPAAQHAFERTERLGGALTMSNPIARGARDLLSVAANILPPLRRPLQRGLAGMDSVYAAGAYTAGAVTAGPELKGWGRAGERMTDPPTAMLRDQLHHLVVLGDATDGSDKSPAADAAARVLELSKRYVAGPVVHLAGRPTRSPRGIESWPTESTADRQLDGPPAAVLIRPDGHIGFTGELDDLTDLSAHLDRWFTRN